MAADEIESKCPINRWTERRAVLLEREIILAMFCVRSLIERSKISKALTETPIDVIAHPKKTVEPVTLLNRGDIHELFDLDATSTRSVTLAFLCNQIIHSYIIFPLRDETRRFSHMLVCSDFERNRFLYTVSISKIVSLIRQVASDYPPHMHLEYDFKIQDYRITNDNALDV